MKNKEITLDQIVKNPIPGKKVAVSTDGTKLVCIHDPKVVIEIVDEYDNNGNKVLCLWYRTQDDPNTNKFIRLGEHIDFD